ncbi:pilin [Psychrobacter aestuarii]|uniref:Type 4a pilus biogenesis protein PilA n=1 Tax=Psychrobacter aestuarii TaxID=556327 RepID=A0ABP3FB79_9GAMM|nr:pilin [Psychrobacter aestuarii]
MNAQKGFTLIELMIVIAIIGILAAIAIPQYQNYIAKSQVSRVMGEVGAMRTATETCLNDGLEATACEFGWTNSNLLGASTKTLQTGLVASFEDTGAATLVATFGDNASTAIKQTGANTLTWTRTDAGAWSCSTTVPAKFKPTGCSGS